jgi:aryl-alcohol dehydrogenase-like predicted oxidoreductase
MRSIDVDGLRVSRIGLGTWQFGAREWGYGETYARETAPALIRRALELGITMIDTAEVYGPGHSERIIGETLANLPAADRAGVTVATKLMPIAPAERIVACQAAGSRRRLQMDALDLYYAHWPNPFVSARRVMQSLRPLVAEGLVRRVGVSNYSLAQWQEAERALRAPVIANQVQFSLVSQGPARELVPYAADHGRLVVAYSPLAQGLLAAERGATEGQGSRRMRTFNPGDRNPRLVGLVAAVREIAAANGATPAQVALAWVLAHPNTIAIPGARTLAQLESNAAAADLVLADDQVARLSVEAEAFAAAR